MTLNLAATVDNDAHWGEFRSGSTLAGLMNLIPHRGEAQRVSRSTLEQQVLERMQTSLFSGMTLLYRDQALVGLLTHFAGRVAHAFLDDHAGTAAIQAFKADQTVTSATVKRLAHPLLVPCGALLDGEVQASWLRPTPQDAEKAVQAASASSWSGVLAWMGDEPRICVYHAGRLFSDFAAPNLEAPGPLVQCQAQANPNSTFFPTDWWKPSAGTPPFQATRTQSPARPAAPQEGNLDDLWAAALREYEKKLGRAATPALEKLKRDLAGQAPEQVIQAIQARLSAAFGPQSAQAFQAYLGGNRQ